MPDSPTPDSETVGAARSHWVDLTPLRESPAFARLWGGAAITAIGGQMTLIAVGLHIYDITHDTLSVAMVGVVSLIPMIIFGLYGGMLADAFDRRKLALGSASIAWLSTLGLALLAWSGSTVLWPFYLFATINAIAATVVGTSRAAIVPRLLPARLLPSAGALNGMAFGAAVVVGPMLAGLLIATVGFPWTYTIDLILFFAGFFGIFTLPPIRPEGSLQRVPGMQSLIEGLRFVRRSPHIRGSFLVDIAAMTFGNPRALMPALGAVVLGGSALTVGLLSAAPAVGSILSSLFSGRLQHVRWQGRAIAWAIYGYGTCVTLFGVVLAAVVLGGTARTSPDFADVHVWGFIGAAIALCGTGITDNISSIFRGTLLQVAAPDEMRGRMQGVFTVVVTGGPRIGDLYMGLAATYLMLWVPPLAGGLLILLVVSLLVRGKNSLVHYDALNPRP